MLRSNLSLGNIGDSNAPLGAPSSGNQGIPTPQHNVGFNPYSMQRQGGTLVSSQPPLGPTQTLFNVQRMGATMFPLIHLQMLDRSPNNTSNP